MNNSLADSTSNANNGTNYSSANSTSGKIGDGRDLTGGSDRVTLANASSIKPTAQLTVSGWFKRNGAQPDYAKPFWFGQDDNDPWGPWGIQFDTSSDTALIGHMTNGTTSYWPYANITSLSNTTWYYLSMTYDGSNVKFYINDVLQDTIAASTTIGNYDGTNGFGIGDSYQGGTGINGYVDEVHISSVARSVDWLKTEYNNQNSPSTFATIGAYSMPSMTNTWTYNNRLAQSVVGSTTIVYSYDHNGQRVRTYNGTTNTHIPSKYYNANGTTEVKTIFTPSGELVATVNKVSGTASVYYDHVDQLTGSNVVTNSGGTVEELMDYYPFGSIRLD
ncbi:MAG TPA: LamG domain-containing protein, partial [Candidatus Paceibacterota bacterium]|nr:LamG domain-containing protein [Candidatus Paceibacterota bacterium]